MISPESRGGPNIALITIVCSWTFLAIALVGVSLQLWVRRIKRVKLGSDDYLILFALAATIALIAQTTWAIVDEGQDDHEAELSRTKLALVVRSLLVNQTLWGLINTLIRMSAVLYIERAFGSKRNTARSLLVLSILYGLVVFLEVFLICHPMAVDWNAFVDGTCGDQIVSYLVLEVAGLVLDFTIIAVPIPVIWRLQLPMPKKIPILILFSVGVLVFIITGLRIQALHMVNAEDFTYSKGYLGLLSALGASLGITIFCAPAVPIVYRILREKIREYASTATHINELSLPMTEDRHTQTHGRIASQDIDTSLHHQRLLRHAIQTHGRSASWDLETLLHHLRSLEPSTRRALRAIQRDEKTFTPASESFYEISLSTLEDDATQTRGNIAQRSMEDSVTDTKLPPHGELHRHAVS